MFTYTVGGEFGWYFCQEHHLDDLTMGYLMLLLDSRRLKTALSVV